MASELIAALRVLLGDDAVSDDAAGLEFYSHDALGAQRGGAVPGPALPLAVVHPSTPAQAAAVIARCAADRIAVVPYGGGTGLMGGARTLRPGVVVATDRLARIREVDPQSAWVWAEAGCVLGDVDAALRPHGLMLAHDPWTVGIATVGGALSTNGLGFLGGKYGSMGEQVLAVEAVLADGALLRTRPPRPHSSGIDLRALFVAGEGQFGLVTAACLRAFRVPEVRELRGWTFAAFERGFAALLELQRAGVTPAVLDYGERFAVPAAVGAWGRNAEPPTLYLGFDGIRDEVAALLTRAAAVAADHGASPLDATEVREFWDSRHVPAEGFAARRRLRNRPALGDDRTSFDYIHVALPASRVLEYRDRSVAIVRDGGAHVIETGLWVHPGLFSLVIAAAGEPPGAAAARTIEVVDACLRLAHDLGGSMEYCHGAGLRLAHLMAPEHGAGLDVMRRIKRALDPDGILNPGKLDLAPP
jgi:alkyldihydroxyacetonephosphate synthase